MANKLAALFLIIGLTAVAWGVWPLVVTLAGNVQR